MSDIIPEQFICHLCGSQRSVPVVVGMRDWEYASPGVFAYYECLNCGAIQLWPFPSQEDLLEAYPADYQQFHDTASRGLFIGFLQYLLDWVTNRDLHRLIPQGAAVLDVGCGNGESLEKARNLGASELWGVDFSPYAIQATTEKGLSAFQGLFLEFELAGASFDLIMMNDYLEHSMTPLRDLAKAHDLLKPQGILIGSVPNFGSLDRRLFGRYWGGSHVPRHLFQFTPKTLRRNLEQAGFRDASITSSPSPTPYSLSFQNLLRKRDLERGNATSLPKGRKPYYNALLVISTPIALLSLLISRAGLVHFRALKR